MKKYLLIILLSFQLAFTTKTYSQNIAINGTGNLPDTSAMLDVSSTNKGFLAPRMTTAQQNAIPLPATGLLIFNTTDNRFNVNTGTAISPVWTGLVTGSGATTNTLGSAVNTMTSTTNGVAATAPIVNSVSNTSSVNTLSTTINGVAGTGVAIVNSNALTNPANTITSTINGVSSTAPAVNTAALSLSGATLTSTVNGVASTGLNLSPAVAAATTNTLGSAVNTMTSTTNGVAATAPIVNSVSNTSSVNTLSTTINGVAGTGVAIVNSNALTNPANTITSTINGVSSTAPAVNTAALSLSGATLTSTVNGVASTGLNLSPAVAAATTNTLGSAVNTMTSTTNGVAATAPIVNSVSNTSSVNTLSTTINGVAGTGVAIINSNTLGSAVNTMTSTTNGVAATAPIVNSVSNTSSVNTLSTTINGVAGTGVAIINSNALSLSGTNLTSTVNGVASSALNLAPAFAASTWALTGNSGITQPAVPATYGTSTLGASENFLGTTDAKDLVFGAKNFERMRILNSNGYIGIGTSAPTKPLDLVSAVPGVGLVKLQNTDVTGYSSIDIWSNTTQIGNIGYANTGGTYPDAFYFATNTTNSMVFATSNTERMRLDGSTGFIGIGNTAPNSPLHITGSLATAVTTVTNANVTLTATNSLVLLSTGNTARTVTLPTSVGITGRIYTIKKIDSGSGTVTIDPNGSQTVDGSTTLVLPATRWKYVTIQSDGANWMVIANN